MSSLISCVDVEAVVFLVLVTSRVPSGNLRFSDWIINRFAGKGQFKDEMFFLLFHQLSSSDELDPVLSSVVVPPPKS